MNRSVGFSQENDAFEALKFCPDAHVLDQRAGVVVLGHTKVTLKGRHALCPELSFIPKLQLPVDALIEHTAPFILHASSAQPDELPCVCVDQMS